MALKSAVCLALMLLTPLGISCGMHSGAQSASDGSPPLSGALAIGTQCPYGMISPTQQILPSLRGCPMDVRAVRLLETSPIYFLGDCSKKTLAIRTQDQRLDSLWQVYPDDHFDIEAGPAWLQLEIPGQGACWIPSTLRAQGRLDCSDQDRLEIHLDRLDAGLSGGGDGTCRLPPGCRLEARASISQCK